MVTGADIKDAVRNENAFIQDDLPMDRWTVSKIDAKKPKKKGKDEKTAWEWRAVYNRQVDSEEG